MNHRSWTTDLGRMNLEQLVVVHSLELSYHSSSFFANTHDRHLAGSATWLHDKCSYQFFSLFALMIFVDPDTLRYIRGSSRVCRGYYVSYRLGAR